MSACGGAASCASVVGTYPPLKEYLFCRICDDDPVGNDRPVGMSAREAEMLDALGAHLSNAQIAGRLHISVRTVERHVASLLRKLGAADRRELAGLAAVTRPTAAPLNLPAPWTTFIGRERERAGVLGALREARLVTLVGPGGVGKTRLAVAVTQEATSAFASGCAFADLVPVRDGLVAQAVASVLGVAERPGQPLELAVLEHLAQRRSLLVLDNCEHVLGEAAAFTGRLLAACPGVRVLATSRERLAVTGERALTIPPLSLIADAADGSEAARLFIDRAHAGGSTVIPAAAVEELCARLDGVPLASSSPRRAAHRWDWTGCSRAWTITCGCWRVAAAPIHGTTRSGQSPAGASGQEHHRPTGRHPPPTPESAHHS
jgi:DNA-binding CsgD family transcriptional regulator